MFCSSPPPGQMMTLQFPLGVQSAVCARVGNALGAGDTQRALLITKIALCLSCQSVTHFLLPDFAQGSGDIFGPHHHCCLFV